MDRPDQERPPGVQPRRALGPRKAEATSAQGRPAAATQDPGLHGPRPRTGEAARTLHSERVRNASPHPGPDPGDVATGQEKPERAQAPTRETNQRRTCARSIRKGMVG
jgi:hypothetical protein